MASLSFGAIKPMNPANLPYTMARANSPRPVLTFGGAYQPVNDSTLSIFSGGNSFGPKVAPAGNSGGILGGLSNFLGGFSMGRSVDPAGPSYGGGIMPLAGQVGQIKTAQIDGSTGWVSGLRESLGGILDYMGSTGDASGQAVVTPVSYQEEGTNWPLILAGLAAAGLVVYAYQSK